MNCPKCNGNGEIEKVEFLFMESDEGFILKQCTYCSGTGYLETNE